MKVHTFTSPTRLFSNQTDPPTIGAQFVALPREPSGGVSPPSRLAILLYRLDHQLQYPRKLDDLVPQYLPAVPQDVHAPDQRPLAYRPEMHPPIVYSVGYNGKDDGGSTDWRSADDVFPLEPTPQKSRPTSRQAEQHQRDQHDGRQGARSSARIRLRTLLANTRQT